MELWCIGYCNGITQTIRPLYLTIMQRFISDLLLYRLLLEMLLLHTHCFILNWIGWKSSCDEWQQKSWHAWRHILCMEWCHDNILWLFYTQIRGVTRRHDEVVVVPCNFRIILWLLMNFFSKVNTIQLSNLFSCNIVSQWDQSLRFQTK